MKKIFIGLVLVSTVSASASKFQFEKKHALKMPTNEAQIASVSFLKSYLELNGPFHHQLVDMNNAGHNIRSFSIASKTKYCAHMGAVSASIKLVRGQISKFKGDTGATIQNRDHVDFLKAENMISDVSNHFNVLKQYCFDGKSYGAELRNNTARKMIDSYLEHEQEVRNGADGEGILIPIDTDEYTKYVGEKTRLENNRKEAQQLFKEKKGWW